MTYEIQKGDTLALIAAKFNLPVSEILNFHNSESALTQQIHSDYIPLHIKTILVKPLAKNTGDIKIHKENQLSNIILAFKQNSKYKIAITTSLFFLGKPLSENKIESIWAVNFDKVNNTVLVEVLDKKHVKVDSQIKPLLEIVEKVNKTTNVLKLQLNEDQTVKDVLNVDDLLKRWERIKFDDLKSLELEDNDFKLIVKGYDAEFNALAKSLQMNMLYQIFFYPQGKVKVPTYHLKILTENKKTISQLFPQQHIEYDLSYKSHAIDDEIKVLCSASSSKNWDTNLLASEYKKNYAQIIPDPFQFDFVMDGQYTHDEGGVLKHGKTYIKEQANDKLFYIGEYNITLLDE